MSGWEWHAMTTCHHDTLSVPLPLSGPRRHLEGYQVRALRIQKHKPHISRHPTEAQCISERPFYFNKLVFPYYSLATPQQRPQSSSCRCPILEYSMPALLVPSPFAHRNTAGSRTNILFDLSNSISSYPRVPAQFRVLPLKATAQSYLIRRILAGRLLHVDF